MVEIQINNSAYSVEKKLKISGADSRRPSLLQLRGHSLVTSVLLFLHARSVAVGFVLRDAVFVGSVVNDAVVTRCRWNVVDAVSRP